eukprot:CAMPEP_0168533806 /NCGR_PEP_ID=MMETSP0405-20121227/17385_1 /TAXON_ID=498012 /ORGANISM="Trichosphaerium sp, Strain Am-I-7 wt" /LENGTH=178 /DNA_ID=CAMNT_0008560115 /DNA_START=24 /DNA_END=560 /DNA_ORIENTATION=+
MRTFSILAIAILHLVVCQVVLVEYDAIEASFLTASSSAAGIIPGVFERGSGIYERATNNAFNSAGFSSTLSHAVGFAEYLEFGFTTSSATTLSSFVFTHRSSGSGPNQLSFQVSIDGGAFAQFATGAPTGTGTVGLHVDFAPGTVATTSAKIRIYPYGASAHQGTYRYVGKITLNGII